MVSLATCFINFHVLRRFYVYIFFLLHVNMERNNDMKHMRHEANTKKIRSDFRVSFPKKKSSLA